MLVRIQASVFQNVALSDLFTNNEKRYFIGFYHGFSKQCVKAWSPCKCMGRKDIPATHVLLVFHVYLGLHRVVMIACIHISQEIFAIVMLTALKPSLEHDRKHVLQWLRL